MTTLGDIKTELLNNLDDPNQTGFTDAKIVTLVNEAIRFIVEQQTLNRYFPRVKEASISVVKDTVSYELSSSPFDNNPLRRPIMIERTDDSRRKEGTIIRRWQRNTKHDRWVEPTVYFLYEAGVWNMYFATHNQPSENQTLLLTYAPEITELVDDSSVIVDVEPEFNHLIVLRATIIGYGGEKNVDNFWLAMYKSALDNAQGNWSNIGLPDEVQLVDDY